MFSGPCLGGVEIREEPGRPCLQMKRRFMTCQSRKAHDKHQVRHLLGRGLRWQSHQPAVSPQTLEKKKKKPKKNQKMKHNQIKSDPKNQKKEETASLLLFPFHFSNVKSGQPLDV